jgi:hypothetical protein
MKGSQIVLPIRVNISGKQIKIFFYRFFHASIVWPYFDNSVNTKLKKKLPVVDNLFLIFLTIKYFYILKTDIFGDLTGKYSFYEII